MRESASSYAISLVSIFYIVLTMRPLIRENRSVRYLCHVYVIQSSDPRSQSKQPRRISAELKWRCLRSDSHLNIMTGFTITDKMTTLLLSYKRDSLAKNLYDFRRQDFSVFHKLVATQAHWKNVTWWHFWYYVVSYMFCNTFKSEMSSVWYAHFPSKQINVNLAWFYCVGYSTWQLGDEMSGEWH